MAQQGTDLELQMLLEKAIQEINGLRRQNEVLSAKVSTMDLFATVLKTQPFEPRQGFGEDVAYELNNKVIEIIQKRKVSEIIERTKEQ